MIGTMNLEIGKEPQPWVNWRDVSPYKVVRDCYFGSGGIGANVNTERKGFIMPSYLVPNVSELSFQTRATLTPYTPWFQLYIDAQFEPLYTEIPPDYSAVSPNAQPFVYNCNRAGMSLNDYKMAVTSSALMDGVVFLASGHDGDTAKNPYLSYYTASEYNEELSVLDAFGDVEKYVFSRHNGKSGTDGKWLHHCYTANTYQQFGAGERDKLGDATTEEVPSYPIQRVYSQAMEQGKVLVTPRSLSVAGLCIAVYNAESDQKWVLRVQGHSIFVIRSDEIPQGVSGGLDSVLHVNTADTQGGAEFVAPPAELSKEHRESKAELIGQLFEIMRHNGVIATRSSQIPESGASKAYTFRPVNAAIARSRAIAETVDAYVVGCFKFYKAMTIDFTVQYNKDFTPSAGVTMLELLDALEAAKSNKQQALARGIIRQIAMYVEAGEEAEQEAESLTLDSVALE